MTIVYRFYGLGAVHDTNDGLNLQFEPEILFWMGILSLLIECKQFSFHSTAPAIVRVYWIWCGWSVGSDAFRSRDIFEWFREAILMDEQKVIPSHDGNYTESFNCRTLFFGRFDCEERRCQTIEYNRWYGPVHDLPSVKSILNIQCCSDSADEAYWNKSSRIFWTRLGVCNGETPSKSERFDAKITHKYIFKQDVCLDRVVDLRANKSFISAN